MKIVINTAITESELFRACQRLESLNRGGTIPWVYNAAHTRDIEALRAICLAFADVWNNYMGPAMETVTGNPPTMGSVARRAADWDTAAQ